MARRWIAVSLLVFLMTVCLTGCGMGIGHGIIKEFTENKDSILEELTEFKDSLVEELEGSGDDIRLEIHELVDCMLEEINDWSGVAATHHVTGDDSLAGERERGADDYVGVYRADYSGFTGEEYIFGGTALKRTNGSELEAAYSLTVTSGTAVLYWLDGEEEKIIADAPGEDVYSFRIHAGGNFLVLKGDNFTGSLTLAVN